MSKLKKKLGKRILAYLVSGAMLMSNMTAFATETSTREDISADTETSADAVEEISADEETSETEETADSEDVEEAADESEGELQETETLEETETEERSASEASSSETETKAAETDNRETTTYVHNFTTDNTTSSFYTIYGNLSTQYGSVEYNGLTLTQCLKMESSTSITFTASGDDGVLTLVFGGSESASGKNVCINGTKYACDSDGIWSGTVSSGTVTITKSDKIYLFYMSYTGEGSADDASEDESGDADDEDESDADDETSLTYSLAIDDDAKDIISAAELSDDAAFVNESGEAVEAAKLVATADSSPSDAVKSAAEALVTTNTNGEGEVFYYDFSLVNAEDADETLTLSAGTVKITMPYSISETAGKSNLITVLHGTDKLKASRGSAGFSFSADGFSPYTVIINPAADGVSEVTLTANAGYEEGVYAEWEPVDGADGYMAYVAEAGGAFERVDDELIRAYEDYWRVDAVGLAAGTYYLKINAVTLDDDEATVIATATSQALTVTNYDRSGFAFSSNSTYKTGSGAYNEDGTLRDGAQVIYVTAETASTVTLDVITSSKGATTSCTGLQAILAAREKGYDTTPLDIRIIGCVTVADLDYIGSKDEGLQIKGKKYSEMNITVEGIGEDATIKEFGFLIRNCGNVELRNFAIMDFIDDGVSVDTDNCNIWVHDLDIFYGSTGGDSDQAKGDGSVDIKSGSTYVTVSYCHFWDSGKCSLCGMEDSTDDEFMVTYHHNWFDHSDSRHARVRRGTVHVYNNYYDGNAKYGIGAANASSIFVEANYFRNCNYPMIISTQASDALGGNIMSSEDGGIIKAYNNVVIGAKNLIYQNSDSGTASANATSFDAYLVANRSDTVPESVVTLTGGTTYNNFDTSSSYDLGVSEENIDTPENVPTVVTAKAGRLNGGDFTWEFDNSTEDTNYSVITALKTAVVNYTSSVVSIGGGVDSDVTVTGDDDSKADDVPTVYPPTASVASGEVKEGTEVTLSCATEGAAIYYTTDGLDPTTDSTLYESAIVINENMTIKAIAELDGAVSSVSTFKYTIPQESLDARVRRAAARR